MSYNIFEIQESDISKKNIQGKIFGELSGFQDCLAIVTPQLLYLQNDLHNSFPISEPENALTSLHPNVAFNDILCVAQWGQNLNVQSIPKIKQLHMEVRLNLKNMFESVQQLRKTYEILQNHMICIHVHANNNFGQTSYQNSRWPEVFDLTWIRKDTVEQHKSFQGSLPTSVDTPSNPKKKEIILRGLPFSK